VLQCQRTYHCVTATISDYRYSIIVIPRHRYAKVVFPFHHVIVKFSRHIVRCAELTRRVYVCVCQIHVLVVLGVCSTAVDVRWCSALRRVESEPRRRR